MNEAILGSWMWVGWACLVGLGEESGLKGSNAIGRWVVDALSGENGAVAALMCCTRGDGRAGSSGRASAWTGSR